MKSHFSLNGGFAVACAVAGASTMLNGNCPAQAFIAADYATNSTYAGGWSAGQNGGYGLGAWSFDGTEAPDNSFTTNGQQGVSSSSPLGTTWTLFNLSSTAGLADAGRAIMEPGGLQVGQTIETVIDNPTTTHFYRGWAIFFNSGNDNIYPGGSQYNPPGDTGLEQVSVYHFEYFNYGQWNVADLAGNTPTTLYDTDTAVAGVKLDFTMTGTNSYHLVMTPLGGSASSYMQDGAFETNGPVNWIQFQLYNNVSSGLNDTADNFEISSITITIQGLMLNIQSVGTNAVLSWSTNAPGFNLASSLALGAAAAWGTNNLPSPAVVNGQNVVTNPIVGTQRYYRLQQ